MNYQKIYNQIIEKRKLEEPEGYTENHHIIPKSLGGINTKDNLVRLTAREHFICHALLLKMQTLGSPSYYKMLKAFVMMSWCCGSNQDRYSSRLYDYFRNEYVKLRSLDMSGQNNHHFGRVRCVPIDAINCKHHVGYFPDQIPKGWITTKEWSDNKKSTRDREKMTLNQSNAEMWYNKFITGNYKSLNDFIKKSEYPYSIEAASKMFQKYINGYNKTPGISKVPRDG